MKENHARLTCAVIGLVACCLAAPAPSQDASTLQCPAGYWRYGSVCIDSATGDVVNAAVARAESETGCAPGYWRLGDVCISPQTGDVELVQERTRAASGSSTAKSRSASEEGQQD
jgi:hypothetical protein